MQQEQKNMNEQKSTTTKPRYIIPGSNLNAISKYEKQTAPIMKRHIC